MTNEVDILHALRGIAIVLMSLLVVAMVGVYALLDIADSLKEPKQ